ncbi:hypothetical protein [Pelagicoccus sp. SDUM812003]|uniref:hypothetical protein n=1 Tax=Pelagicoccus sp. SDUM812003 TaxID=3041267 RepID=UPI00280D11A3|nr:hypothetical protein [Pelagicoccus sp. SDUM812003]MDQ8203175.1 hypothetical protein [Pelagicoccus sp. SDUM812003]
MELHTYFSNLGLLRVSWGPVIDTDSIRRHFDLLIANKNYARDLKIITSAEVEELAFPLTHEKMETFRRWREEALTDYDSLTTAFYSIKPVPAAYIDYFSEFFDTEKSLMRQFSSQEAALKWLIPGYQPNGLMELYLD